jgi:hypothetical protein
MHTTRYLSILILPAVLVCCQNKKHPKLPPDTTRQGNIYTTHSHDTTRLAKLIDLKAYKPTAVEFHYIYIDNSGEDDFFSTPGPSDSYLQAVLYFDSITYSRLAEVCNDPPSDSLAHERYEREDFIFPWLTPGIQNELLKSDSGYHNYTCPPFSHTKVWLLDKKIILRKESI